jgi:hypothetical protein
MGQCKSKVQALDDSDREKSEASRLKKSAKRRWRKSKGYSLSASLEGDLDLSEGASLGCGDDRRSEGRGGVGAAVLLSYNVREERKRIGEESAGGSLLPPPASWAGEDVEDKEEEEEAQEDLVSRELPRLSVWQQRDRLDSLASTASSGSQAVGPAADGPGRRPGVDKLKVVPPPSFAYGPSAVPTGGE